jgi:hypothetical protein
MFFVTLIKLLPAVIHTSNTNFREQTLFIIFKTYITLEICYGSCYSLAKNPVGLCGGKGNLKSLFAS